MEFFGFSPISTRTSDSLSVFISFAVLFETLTFDFTFYKLCFSADMLT